MDAGSQRRPPEPGPRGRRAPSFRLTGGSRRPGLASGRIPSPGPCAGLVGTEAAPSSLTLWAAAAPCTRLAAGLSVRDGVPLGGHFSACGGHRWLWPHRWGPGGCHPFKVRTGGCGATRATSCFRDSSPHGAHLTRGQGARWPRRCGRGTAGLSWASGGRWSRGALRPRGCWALRQSLTDTGEPGLGVRGGPGGEACRYGVRLSLHFRNAPGND